MSEWVFYVFNAGGQASATGRRYEKLVQPILCSVVDSVKFSTNFLIFCAELCIQTLKLSLLFGTSYFCGNIHSKYSLPPPPAPYVILIFLFCTMQTFWLETNR